MDEFGNRRRPPASKALTAVIFLIDFTTMNKVDEALEENLSEADKETLKSLKKEIFRTREEFDGGGKNA